MGRLEKAILAGLLVGLASCGLTLAYLDWQFPEEEWLLRVGISLGCIGGFMGWCAIALALRDLYLRDFTDPNAKMLWTLAILMTAGIGFVVYIFVHAVKPRPVSLSRSAHSPALPEQPSEAPQ
jgi:hypothetical protein